MLITNRIWEKKQTFANNNKSVVIYNVFWARSAETLVIVSLRLGFCLPCAWRHHSGALAKAQFWPKVMLSLRFFDILEKWCRSRSVEASLLWKSGTGFPVLCLNTPLRKRGGFVYFCFGDCCGFLVKVMFFLKVIWAIVRFPKRCLWLQKLSLLAALLRTVLGRFVHYTPHSYVKKAC